MSQTEKTVVNYIFAEEKGLGTVTFILNTAEERKFYLTAEGSYLLKDFLAKIGTKGSTMTERIRDSIGRSY